MSQGGHRDPFITQACSRFCANVSIAATAAFGNVDEATKQAAAPIIRKLGFRFDGENVKLAELLSDLRKFYSAHPLAHDRELTRSDGLSDLVGAKYWGLTARSHLVELAPYWPDDLYV